MDTITLQIPLARSLRDAALDMARDSGFSSLQEVIRVFLSKFVKKEVGVAIERFPAVKLSTRNAKRYDKMVDDILSGKVKTKSFDSVDDLMHDLMN